MLKTKRINKRVWGKETLGEREPKKKESVGYIIDIIVGKQ